MRDYLKSKQLNKNASSQSLTKIAALAVAATTIGAFIVSTLKGDQVLLSAVLLIIILGSAFYSAIQKRSNRVFILKILLALTTGTIGYLTEFWGTSNGHWTYHFLPNGQVVPMWVPLAWAIAADLLFRFEAKISNFEAFKSQPVLVMSFCGIIFPLIGESICIANGVWDYHWPYRILGVPLLALILIAWCHVTLSFIQIGMLATHGNIPLSKPANGHERI